MKKHLFILFLSGLFICSAYADDAAQILFHDSKENSFFDPSWVSQTAPSVMEVAAGKTDKLPVSTDIRQSGDNALRLSWKSVEGGNWLALVAGIDWPAYRMENVTRLSFWVYAPDGLETNLLPDINMEGHFGGQCAKLKLSDYVQSVPRAEWVRVTIPMADFYNASSDFKAFNCIKGVFFHQSATDGVQHTLYVDEMNFENLTTDLVFNDNKLSGHWTFDDKTRPYVAVKGNVMEPSGDCRWVQGTDEADGAIEIPTGVENYLKIVHDIRPNGITGTSERVNEYALLYDIRFSELAAFSSLIQTDLTNQSDGGLSVRSNGSIGRAGTIGYSAGDVIKKGEWVRLVVNVSLGEDEHCFYNIYVNGCKVFSGERVELDNVYFSLEDAVLLFADDDGDNGHVQVSRFALFNTWLTDDEIMDLGGFPVVRKTEMLPYLQAPTPTSIIVNWHTLDKNLVPQVKYGTNPDHLDHTATGSNELIVDHIWNTVKLIGLQPDTEYFYQCVSGEYQSEVCAFRTFKAKRGGKVRLIMTSDSQDDDAVTTELVNKFTTLLKEKYGDDLHNHIHMMCHMGDAVSGGGVIEQYENRYYRPFSSLTHAIPATMVTGNHDVEHKIFYSYAKYDDFANGVDGLNQEAFYTLKVNGVQLYMLNTNEGMRVQPQLDWLDRELQKTQQDDDVAFALACCHHVYYSEFWPNGSGAGLTEDSYQGTPYVGELLKRLQTCSKVPALFNGHVHDYERHVLPGQCAGGRDFLEVTVGGAGGILDRWGMNGIGPDIYEGKVALDHYHFVLLEIDVDNMAFEGTMYSFGNPDRPLDGDVCDTFYGKLDQPAPGRPAVSDFTPDRVTVSDYAGTDSLMTVQVQIADNLAFDHLLFDKKFDKVNIYDVDENFIPINQNAGIDLKHIDVSEAGLTGTDNLYVRVRYRDNNLKWSEWSEAYSPSLSAISETINDKTALQAYQYGDVLRVRFRKNGKGKGGMALYNMLAQPVYQTDLDDSSMNWDIPVVGLPQGVYFLRFTTEDGERQVKVMLNR